MTTQLLSEKFHDQLDGVLNCYDRIVLTGSLHPFCYAQGMTGYLSILLQFLRLPSNAFCGKDIGNLSTEAHDGNPRPSTLLRLFVAL
jgi:hypothetical protein